MAWPDIAIDMLCHRRKNDCNCNVVKFLIKKLMLTYEGYIVSFFYHGIELDFKNCEI